jgi:nicotinate-nucleotide pyrophosphorylase
MEKFTYKITVEAKDNNEATKKLQAACILLDFLNEKEISKLAYVVKHDPVKTRMAKIALGV